MTRFSDDSILRRVEQAHSTVMIALAIWLRNPTRENRDKLDEVQNSAVDCWHSVSGVFNEPANRPCTRYRSGRGIA
jgi:hypothetical protein